MRFKTLFAVIGLTITAACCAASLKSNEPASATTAQPEATPAAMKSVRDITYTDGEFDGNEIIKTDAEWKKVLTPVEYNILREAGTERPYSNPMVDNHKHGIYYCAACGLALFRSETKFESGTGWPSFYQAMYKKNVIEKVDNSLGEERTEVICARCHGHLGHVFDDGPEPTGLRYCMNSPALAFKETPETK